MENNIVEGEIISNHGLSPNPISVTKIPEPKTMSFPEVIKELLSGRKITKLEWKNADDCGFIKDERLKIVLAGVEFDWIISQADMEGTDWIVKEEVN